MNARKNDNRVFLNVVNASAHSATPHSVTIIDSSPDLITIIDSSPDLIFFKTADGLYDRCNKAFLDFLGVSREQVIGKSAVDVWPAGTGASINEQDRRIIKSGNAETIEEILPRSDGRKIIMETIKVPLFDSEGKAHGIAGMSRDIAERKTNENRLLESVLKFREIAKSAEESNRQKSQFMAVMSHEIRTPMTAFLGAAGMLAETKLDESQRELLDIMLSSGDGLQTLLNDFLSFSKGDAGQPAFVRLPFSPPVLLREVTTIAEGMKHGSKVTLEYKADGLPEALYGDQARIRQVMINMVSNAVKFTDKGVITLSAEAAGDKGIRFAVRDCGPGIDKNEQHRLFQPFSQLGTTSRRRTGVGLGLAICRQLVEGMGGTIGVNSIPGEGSEFYFFLPLETAPALPEQKTETETTLPPRLNILLAEDAELSRRVLTMMLERDGHKVDAASSGEAAVEAMTKGRRYDVILMDLQMPGMDGLEAAGHIRALADPAMARAPIIALTANVMPEIIARCREAGMDQIITKPVSPSHLRRILMSIVENARAPKGKNHLFDDEIMAELENLYGAAGMSELVQSFNEQAKTDLHELADARSAGNLKLVAKIAHLLAGKAGSVAAAAFSAEAQACEKAALTMDDDALARHAEQLNDLFRRTADALMERFDKKANLRPR
ncbi:MAG: hypothetical protein A3G18_10630 [Rhodospirillales bacterium RIFCSPLOWO2_12_FULL_58_28]|nr:MAG: hypothetical protein A3H92_10990 [Rhodospirillales bacterium RIFCSPLOWO2_02_FULL_58_16]OHC77876.1 MAG: hypothetical protein A3G18_10630 [Rhodospirillales bacterium RIFCSPLOWO2_12_FULL_58_28]